MARRKSTCTAKHPRKPKAPRRPKGVSKAFWSSLTKEERRRLDCIGKKGKAHAAASKKRTAKKGGKKGGKRRAGRGMPEGLRRHMEERRMAEAAAGMPMVLSERGRREWRKAHGLTSSRPVSAAQQANRERFAAMARARAEERRMSRLGATADEAPFIAPEMPMVLTARGRNEFRRERRARREIEAAEMARFS